MTIIRQSNSVSWRDRLNELKAGKDRFMQYQPIMTQYEQATIAEDLGRKQSQFAPLIIAGMLQEYHQAVSAFEDARKAEARERAAEINRWDSSKLAAEIQLTQARLADLAGLEDPSAVLSGIMQEAEASGDMHKRRAVAEVVRASLAKMGGADMDNRRGVNRVAKQAEQVLNELRTTEAMQKANQEASQAFDAIWSKQREMESVEDVIGKSIEFQRAWGRVQVDHSTGEITVKPMGG